MKTTALFSFAVLAATSSVRAQGPLTPPPGAPAPVMKSLDQIEARTPLNSLSGDATACHVITLPGSYYLTGPLMGQGGKAGIRIEAVNVTLDLGGFTVEGVGGSTTGILINVADGPVSIRNGALRFWTTGGIVGLSAPHVSLEDLAISSISAGPGIWTGNHSVARRISVKGAHRAGIHLGDAGGIASQCTVENFGVSSWTLNPDFPYAYGIDAAVISDSTVRGFGGGSGSADGVTGIHGNVVERCAVSDLTLPGLNANGITSDTVRACEVSDISSAGAEVSGIRGSVIEGNAVRDIAGFERIGIEAGGYNGTILNNHLTRCQISSGAATTVSGNRVSVLGGQTGIKVQYSGCKITGNTISIGNGSAGRGILVTGVSHEIYDNLIQTGTSAFAIRLEASRNVVRGNAIGVESAATGISVPTGYGSNRIDGNTLTGGSVGIGIANGASNNILTRNSVSGAAAGYSYPADTQAGPVIAADDLTTASPWANLTQP